MTTTSPLRTRTRSLLIERWESAAHQRVHMEQPHMARLREIKDKYIAATKLGRVHLED